jgi:hypothetical protein
MVGSPLADTLMQRFAGPESVGVWQTFLVLAAIYFVFMMVGGFAYRVPPDGWAPESRGDAGRRSNAADPRGPSSGRRSFTVARACRTRQFWLVWLVLCLNVSAGIGVIGMASPMRPSDLILLAGFWLFVTIPMGWGVWATIRQAAVLFQ